MKQFLISAVISLTLIGCGGSSTSKDTKPIDPVDPVKQPGQPNDGLPALSPTTPDATEHLSGGDVTTVVQNEDAFSQSAPSIRSDFELDGVFKSGDHLFRTTHRGQGPLFNNATCQGCHIKDGRGEVPRSHEFPMISMFMRISDGEGKPDPIYGDQLQTFGTVAGHEQGALPKHNGAIDEGLAYGEAYAYVQYEYITGQYSDGMPYELRKPIYKVKDLAYGDFNADVRLSPRVSPAVFGSGLLSAIPENYITSYADPDDINQDGISGRAVYVTEPLSEQKKLARFGYKAVTASVLQQISGAYRGDMGITNLVNPEEPCTDRQAPCIAEAATEHDIEEGGLDLSKLDLAQVEFYNRLLAVPKRRGYDENTQQWQSNVIAGRRLFYQANCQGCHVPRHKTGQASASLLGDAGLLDVADTFTPIAALSDQVIYPYTDLLLHDMGGGCEPIKRETQSGERCSQGADCHWVQRCEGLADGRIEGSALESEWKTPALWGLGLVQVVNPKATFLHDGRARTLSEAILWHGGEAEKSKQAFIDMTQTQRQQLIAFLESL